MTESLFTPKLVQFRKRAQDAESLLRDMAAQLLRAQVVTESFADAVVAREADFPTGLPTQPVAVAIPHCAPGHVLKPRISVRRLEEPVTFREMGSATRQVEVRLVCMLCLMDGRSQLSTLQRLMTAFATPATLERLYAAVSPTELYRELMLLMSPAKLNQ